MDYTRTTLSNGLRLITVELPSLESASLTVWVKVGSRYEPDKIAGTSHLLEHMAFKGSKKFPTSQLISEFIDTLGAEYNAGTSHEWINYYMKVRSDNLEKAFEILSDISLNPLLDAHELEKEKGVILEEIAMHDDTPMEKIGDIFGELVFAGNSLGRDISGTKESVSRLTRSDILSYRERYYFTDNMLLTVAGGIKTNDVKNIAEKYFRDVKNGKIHLPVYFKSTQTGPKLKVEYKKSEQAHLILGFLSHGREHPDRYAELILSTILGKGMSSRLFSELRFKRALAYAIFTSTSKFVDTGVFATYAGVDLKKIDEAITVILDQHYGIALEKYPLRAKRLSEPAAISKEELNKAKEYLKGRAALALEDTLEVNDFFGQRALFQKTIETPEEVFARIDKVTTDDVYRVARDLFVPEKLNLAIIGPYHDQARFKKLLA